MKKKVLIISRFFPPMFDIGGKRAYRFARFLPRYGWQPIVITAKPPDERLQDPTSGGVLDEGVVVQHNYFPFWWRSRGGAGSDGTQQKVTQARQYPPERLYERLIWQFSSMPVANDVWLAPRFAMLARKLARKYKAEAIFATSSPYSALVYGAVARAATGLPLILDLRDPWSLNFLQERKPPWVRKVESLVEERLLASADAVTCTCEESSNAYRKLYPQAKIHTIYNSFDPEQQPATKAPADEAFEMVHFGNCYGIRRLDTILRAMAVIKERRGLKPTELRLRNLGRLAESDVQLAESLGIRDYLVSQPFVPYEEGLRVLTSAGLQLLIAYGSNTLFVPAKIYDYMLSGAPVLCQSEPSELTSIIEKTGMGRSIAPGDVAGAVDCIEAAIEAHNSGPPFSECRMKEMERFSAPHTTQQLATLLDGIVPTVR